MKTKTIIPHIPFYFVRHGETDWNRINGGLCKEDEIPLNQTGLLQATKVCKQLDSLNITKICSSPLKRAKQTAEIIRDYLNEIPLEFYPDLGKISDETIGTIFAEILKPSQTLLIVSHGEVYRILLRILDAQSVHPKAKNCGLYFFNPPSPELNQWTVSELGDEYKNG